MTSPPFFSEQKVHEWLPGNPSWFGFLHSKSHGNLQAQEGLDSLQPDVLSKATEALKDFQRGGARHAPTAWVTFK